MELSVSLGGTVGFMPWYFFIVAEFLFSCRFLAVETHEVHSDKYERNAEPLPHIQRHCAFKIHLILFQELDEEAEYEYFSQAEAEEEAAVVG